MSICASLSSSCTGSWAVPVASRAAQLWSRSHAISHALCCQTRSAMTCAACRPPRLRTYICSPLASRACTELALLPMHALMMDRVWQEIADERACSYLYM